MKCEEWLGNVQITLNELVRSGNFGFQQSPEVMPENTRGYTIWGDAGKGVKLVVTCEGEAATSVEADVTITPETDLKKLKELVDQAFGRERK
jgi:hypothetical protein